MLTEKHVVMALMREGTWLLAYDKKTGKLAWKVGAIIKPRAKAIQLLDATGDSTRWSRGVIGVGCGTLDGA